MAVQVNEYKLHRLEEGPEREVETSKGELLQMFRCMYTVSKSQIDRLGPMSIYIAESCRPKPWLGQCWPFAVGQIIVACTYMHLLWRIYTM